MTETYEILEGNYNSELDVRVQFTQIVEVPNVQVYSEQDVLNTIASLEQQKVEFCALKDAEIEINNQMLLKIRAIDRTLNITE